MEESGEHLAGVRFLEIVTADQERINLYVLNELKAQGKESEWNNSRRDLLTIMHY